MLLDWEQLFKRYIIDDEKTPYFTPVAKLTRRQARYELFAYCLLTGVLYAMVGIASLSSDLPHGGAIAVPLYAFSLVLAVLLLGLMQYRHAAAYAATGPIGALLYFLQFGFQPESGAGDKILIVVLLLLWARYNFRILAIARAFRDMPERPAP